MLITSQPASWNQRDSARVEKRGPWIVTTVPPSRTGIPELARGLDEQRAQVGAVRVGGGDVRRLGPS
jgi:hypothetical protein